MKRSFRRAQRLLTVAVLFFVLAVSFTVPIFATGAYCVAGDFNGWSDTANPMTESSSGFYTLDAVIATASQQQFKVVTGCNWANGSFPTDSNNAWFITSVADQPVTLTFDTNTYPVGFVPTTNIYNVLGDTLPSINAVGAYQGWDNANPDYTLENMGGGLWSKSFTVASPGTYEAKLTATGSWSFQFTSQGRQTDGGTVSFTTVNPDETVIVTLDTNTGRFRFAPQGDGGSGASQDNNIWWGDLGHDSRDPLYRNPAGSAEAGTPIILRFRAANGDLTGVTLRVWDDRFDNQYLIPMTRVYGEGQYEWWEATLNTGFVPNVFYYRFIARDGTATAFYEDADFRGGWGEASATSVDRSWQITMFDPDFSTPDWVKNAVIYQIFPDRFRDGNPSNNQPAGMFFYNETGGTVYRSNGTAWNTPICDPRVNDGINDGSPTCTGSWSRNFYGGDLQGILDKVSYLKDLGVTAVYLNPIFWSPSNHKYDTHDFSQIDPHFGDLALFQQLVTALQAEGIKIILDGVFNHTSSDSLYFDRYSRWNAAGELAPAPGTNDGTGACESLTSGFVDWYSFYPHVPSTDTPTPPCSDGRDYPKWFGIFDSLPVLRTAEKPAQDLIWGDGFAHPGGVTQPIGPYWAQWIDGWRLDVSPEVDHGIQHELTDGRQQYNPYWEEFRKAVHAVNPELYIVGEEWGLATSWTSGGVSGGVDFSSTGNPGEWDATMNYQQSAAILSFWRDTYFEDNDFNPGSSAGPLAPASPSQVNARILNLQERYAPEAFAAMMNLFGSHDTNRVLFLLDHGHPSSPGDNTVHPASPMYDWSDAIMRLKGAALMQMTLPGAPTIYYGDEVGLVGQSTYSGGKWEDDPYNRVPYPWLDETGTPFFTHLQSDAPGSPRADLLEYYQTLTDARNNHAVLRTGSFDPLLTDDANNVYVYGRKLADDYAIVIINRATVSQSVTVNVDGYAPYGGTFDDLLTTGVETYVINGSGEITVPNVPAMGGVLLIMDPSTSAPPIPDTNILMGTVTATSVEFEWGPAVGATEYRVYRSRLSGGGYELIHTGPTVTYTDTTVVAGNRYYYVVTGRSAVSGLVSKFSNEVSAMPTWELNTAYRNVQSPSEITGHVISTLNRTPNIYGQIYIAGGTDVIVGQTPGIRAQVGWGTGDPAIDPTGWEWSEMTFNGEAGNNDEYVGSLLPDQTGDFKYTIRYSSDNGVTWLYASEYNGGGSPLRDLEVVASSDTTAPTAPVLSETNRSSGSISLAWTESTDDEAVAFYRLYRSVSGDNAYSLIATQETRVYVDESVTANAIYDYYVTAVDTSFNVSGNSNVVTVTAEDVPVEVTFTTTVPSWTPAGTVFIVGNQPVWGPWNPSETPMTEIAPNVWQWTGTFLSGTSVTFKHTRGSWDVVEKDADGYAEIEHTFVVTDQGDQKHSVNTTLLNWRDLIVLDYTPEDGAVVLSDTPVTVSWNKNFGASEFDVLDSNGNPVAGVYTHDVPTRTTTFTPASLSAGVYTVDVSGFSSGGDNQYMNVAFSFEVENVGVFNLLSPVNGAFFRAGDDLTDVVWEVSTGATEYSFNLYRLSNNARIGTVVEVSLDAVDVCDDLTGLCTLSVPSGVQDLLTTGYYSWTVLASEGSLVREASNGAFLFTVNDGVMELLVNGGFEVNDGQVPTSGWAVRAQAGSRIRCDKIDKTFAFDGECAWRFKGAVPANGRLQQKPSTDRFGMGETLELSLWVTAKNANIGKSIAVLKIVYQDGEKEKIQISLPGANVPDYIRLSATLNIVKPVDKLVLNLRFNSATGNVFIDNVSLTATPLVIVPDALIIPEPGDVLDLPEPIETELPVEIELPELEDLEIELPVESGIIPIPAPGVPEVEE